MNGARFIAETLHRYGVTHVFFVDAILRRTLVELESLGVARVLAHSEKAAAYMADGYARVSGRPAVCLAQSVGAANLAAGLQDAFLHRAPVIALTGRKPPEHRYRNAYQEIEHALLFAPVTKFHAEAERSEQLPILLPQLFREATEGSPRPVHLDLCGLQGEVVEAGDVGASPVADECHTHAPARRPPPDLADVRRAARLLATAERPVLVCGAAAVLADAHRAVRELAEWLHIPVATSTGGRGILPTTHPLHVGTVGTYSAPSGNRIVHGADLVIFVSCQTGDQVTTNWTIPAPGTPIVQIDADAHEIGRNYPGTVGIFGDPGLALDALRAQCDDGGHREAWARHAAAAVADWRASVEEATRADTRPIRVERLCREIAVALPPGAVLVADTGYSAIWTATLVDLQHDSQAYLRAAGSLGWAFPAALGAKCAAPDRPVMCFCGDGAFYYHLSELETARRRKIPVVTVVNNNSGFAQGLWNVRALYGDAPGNPDEIIRFGPTDFAEVARAFGVAGIRVEEPAEIGSALRHAFELGEPVVVDVVTDAETRAPDAWARQA